MIKMDPKCCCGADKSNPCECMKQEITDSCSSKEPQCPCFSLLSKQKSTKVEKSSGRNTSFDRVWRMIV
tara:strand:- start:2431 stop:2637 length:207 start_codon:yes stop_codon:yes gene_type:complete